MNILYILHQFFPMHYTGTERHTLDMAKQMQKMGHYVTVLTYEPDPIRKNVSDSKIWSSEEEYEKEDDFQQIDDYIKKSKLGHRSRAEVVSEALRRLFGKN